MLARERPSCAQFLTTACGPASSPFGRCVDAVSEVKRFRIHFVEFIEIYARLSATQLNGTALAPDWFRSAPFDS
jgi:hypothetical protein